MEAFSLMRVRIHDIDHRELSRLFDTWLEDGQSVGKIIVTPNPEMVFLAQKNVAFLERLNRADLSLPDGIGLRYATAALTERSLQNRHTGVDTLHTLAQRCQQKGKRLLFFGGDPEAAKEAARAMRELYPGLDIHAHDPGWIEWDKEGIALSERTLQKVHVIRPDVIAVGLGQQKQELCMERLRDALPRIRIAIGVGGAFEMLSGQRVRAPRALRRAGLEFCWRLLIEPRRIGRIVRASVLFPLSVAYEAFQRRRLLRACRRVIPEIFRQLTQRYD